MFISLRLIINQTEYNKTCSNTRQTLHLHINGPVLDLCMLKYSMRHDGTIVFFIKHPIISTYYYVCIPIQ